jgi:hypothetical protein
MREDLAKKDAKERSAKLKADIEEQLAKTYRADDERWAVYVAEARRVVKEMDARLAEICRQQGIPEAFRPSINTYWESRGENANMERRQELRKVADARIAALEREAIAAIERRSVEIQERLIAGGLTSAAERPCLLGPPVSPPAPPGACATGGHSRQSHRKVLG